MGEAAAEVTFVDFLEVVDGDFDEVAKAGVGRLFHGGEDDTTGFLAPLLLGVPTFGDLEVVVEVEGGGDLLVEVKYR